MTEQSKCLTVIFHLYLSCSVLIQNCSGFCSFTHEKEVVANLWNSCSCIGIDYVDVRCSKLQSAVLTELPQLNQSTTDNGAVVSLTIVKSKVNYLNQDSFRANGQALSVLIMEHNSIESVNVNAFRGLQGSLTKLSLNNNYLTAMPTASLIYLSNLHYLEVQNNFIDQITSNAFAQTRLSNLRFLHLDGNLLSQLPAKVFSALGLEVLTADNNRIGYIDNEALPATLWWLSLKNNALEKMPLEAIRSLKSLQRLDLGGNRLQSIAPVPELTFKRQLDLDLSNNRLRKLDKYAFRNFRKFKKLDLSFNQIAYIPNKMLETVEYLEWLDLSHNVISGIPDGTLQTVATSLNTLNLEENELHTLPSALLPLTNLQSLNLKYNKLTFLSKQTVANFQASLKHIYLGYNTLLHVPTDALQNMSSLEKLDLSQNWIKELPNMAFGSFAGAAKNLAELNLNGNSLKTITDQGSFMYMSKLMYLDLSYNQLLLLSPRIFSRLLSLETLNLQGNRLIHVPFEALNGTARLRILRLNDNQIVGLPGQRMTALPQLMHLTLARNQIQSVTSDTFPALHMKNLKSVDLSNNRLQHLSSHAFSDLKSIETIDLHSNELPHLLMNTFNNLSNLHYLDLSLNRINHTQPRTFQNLPRLSTLNIAQNRLSTIPKLHFVGLQNLEWLNLAQNRFKTFNASFLDSPKSLKHLDLSFNRLKSVELEPLRTSLLWIDLSNNELSIVGKTALSGLNKLETLNLSSNGMVQLDGLALQASVQLNHIRVSGNYLGSLQKATFSHQKMIYHLDLSHNAIGELISGVFGKDNVQSLDLSENRFQAIPFAGLNTIRNSLRLLDMSTNKITSLQSSHFDGLMSLTVLILRHNSIDTIEEASFEGLQKLERLDISHNPITTWHPQAFRDISHSINRLDLADTGLFSMPRIGKRTMAQLNISMNQIYQLTIEDFKPLKKLHSLDISHNQLKSLEEGLFETLIDLKQLNLSHNQLTVLNDGHIKSLHKLQVLELHNLPFLELLPSTDSFRWLRNLQKLHLYQTPGLRHRPLQEILANLPPLRTLHIEITDQVLANQLHAADFRFLNDLKITGQNLKRIESTALQNIRGYQFRLAITGTELQTFPESIFHTMNQITLLELELSNNLLRTIEPFAHLDGVTFMNQHGTMLYDLDLSENLLICDCRLAWVNPWMRHWQRILPYDQFLQRLVAWNRTRCTEPQSLKHQTVTSIDFGKRRCADETSAAAPNITFNKRQLSIVSLAIINFALVFSTGFQFLDEQASIFDIAR